MTSAQLLRAEAGSRYRDVASDPATQSLCATTLAAMRQGTKYTGFANDFEIFVNEDIVGANDSLQSPTLIIYDAEDPMASTDHVDWFATKFPICTVQPIHAAGHLVWVGPEAGVMNGIRTRFLREHLARPLHI